MNFDRIYDYANGIGCLVQRNVPMSRYTTFHIGGNAAVMLTPSSDEQLESVLKKCFDEGIKPFILGNGSNMLICDEGLDTVVINMCRDNAQIRLEGEDVIVCDAGATMSRVCNFALENGLTGLEFAFGIPGSAGGAAYMNAGAYGGEMRDVVRSAKVLNKSGEIVEIFADEMELSYRHSAFQSGEDCILSVTMQLCRKNPDEINEIKARMDEVMQKRRDKQPLEYPSCGSTFKRPENGFAAAMIEECGLKGFSIGGAQVSAKHSGFVINKGGATLLDIKKLVSHIKQTVREYNGVELECEMLIIEN